MVILYLVRGIYYSYYGRTTNQSLNWYMALRTAPLICSIQSMTSYTIHLVVMIYKYGQPKKTPDEISAYVKKMQLSYWGIFLLYLGVWFFIWRMCVTHEAIVSMDWILTVIYFAYLLTQFYLVKQLYSELKRVSIEKFEREASCYMFAIKLIIIIHIGMRIVFNTLSDSESRIQGNLS
jgi:hypothetical protein